MPSFDIVSEIDLQEVDNAVNITKKTIATRYDFRGSETELELNKKEKTLRLVTEDTMKLGAVKETLAANLVKRAVSPKAVEYSEPEPSSKGGVRCNATLKSGIDREMAKKIVKLIKDSKLKVQTQIQDEQVRVTGKKIDDLQEVIRMVKAQEYDIALQYINMKS